MRARRLGRHGYKRAARSADRRTAEPRAAAHPAVDPGANCHDPLVALAPGLREAYPDAGHITLLSLAFATIALALVLVIASASAVHLDRKQLLSVADAAALDAADAIDLDRFYAGAGGVDDLPMSDAHVRAAVEAHLRVSPQAAELAGLAIAEPTGTADGRSVQVTLVAVARTPLASWSALGLPSEVPIRASTSARASEPR